MMKVNTAFYRAKRGLENALLRKKKVGSFRPKVI